MFDRALELKGPVGPGTMYGFVPAVALGGPIRVDNIEVVDAQVHMQLLSDMTPRQIIGDV